MHNACRHRLHYSINETSAAFRIKPSAGAKAEPRHDLPVLELMRYLDCDSRSSLP